MDPVGVAVIVVDSASPIAPYEQVRAGLAAQIADGSLVAGTRLPTVRALAGELGLAVNTVARAYRELESAGMVQTRGRAGTVVTAGGHRGLEELQRAATDYAARARALGLDTATASALIEAALRG